MENSNVIGNSLKRVGQAISVILSLIAVYLFFTAIPAWLGLMGIGQTSPGGIADAMARMVLGFVFLAVGGLITRFSGSILSD